MSRMIALLLLINLITSCDENKIIYVADHLGDCNDNSIGKCLKIAESKTGDWVLLSEKIEGFEYKEGYTYKIEVNIKKNKNPTADGYSLKYKLVRIIYQEKTEIVAQPTRFEGKWQVSEITGIDSLSKSPTITIDNDSGKISGNAGCNKYGASFSIEGDKITFNKTFTTKRYCNNMTIEDAFFDCLRNSHHYKLVDGKLKIYGRDDSELFTCMVIK